MKAQLSPEAVGIRLCDAGALRMGLYRPGKRGLVFAVGTEPLPAMFASFGCAIVATDIFPEQGWRWDGIMQTSFVSGSTPEQAPSL